MASLKGLSRAAVESTLDEFDALGQEAFLEKYNFGEAKGLYLIRDGKRYDSKAIVGVAIGRLPGRSPLVSRDFRGGVASVVRVLKRLGYEVVDERPSRNPRWAPEEVVLALDVYLAYGLLDDKDPPVIRLSEDLNALDVHPDRPDAHRWRNPNSAALKLGNFAHFDPAYPGRGLDAGSKLDRRIWDLLSPYPDLVRELADRVRAGERIDLEALPVPTPSDGDDGTLSPALSTGVVGRSAPVEGHHSVGKYDVTTSSARRLAERLEQPLVHAFCEFLGAAGYDHGRTLYTVDGVTYKTDLVVEQMALLIEAKFHPDRASIRMAVGQVKDYDYMQSQACGDGGFGAMALLLGARPTRSVVGYLGREGVGAVWTAEDGWAATVDVQRLLPRCRWGPLTRDASAPLPTTSLR